MTNRLSFHSRGGFKLRSYKIMRWHVWRIRGVQKLCWMIHSSSGVANCINRFVWHQVLSLTTVMSWASKTPRSSIVINTSLFIASLNVLCHKWYIILIIIQYIISQSIFVISPHCLCSSWRTCRQNLEWTTLNTQMITRVWKIDYDLFSDILNTIHIQFPRNRSSFWRSMANNTVTRQFYIYCI